MAKISVVTDVSGSMSVLGKGNVIASMKQTFDFCSRFNSDLEIQFSDWNGKDELPVYGDDSMLLITDGHSEIINRIESKKKIAIVLCGADCNLNLKTKFKSNNFAKVFYANEILNAIDFLTESE